MATSTYQEKLQAFGKLLNILDDLREKCPWDKKQTFQTLRLLTIEEMYELAEEILAENYTGIEEELGDIMLHTLFYALLGQEQGKFDIGTVLNRQAQKMINRHPHIYGDVKVESEEDVKRNWEQIKLKEGKKKTVLQGVPRGLPALVKAYRLQQKTAQVGFDWDTIDQVEDKVKEEFDELKEAIANNSKEEMEAEFGDLLFALVNYGRFLNLDPEAALERTNAKFKWRFEFVEQKAGSNLQNMSLDELDAIWDEAKQVERNQK